MGTPLPRGGRAPLVCGGGGHALSPCRQVPRVLPSALLPGAGVRRGRHCGLGTRRPGGPAAPPGLPGACCSHPAPGHRWGRRPAGGGGPGARGRCGGSLSCGSQGTTWAGSCAGARATAGRTRSLCCCQWTRRMPCSWTAGPSCWTLTSLPVGRTARQTQSPPRYWHAPGEGAVPCGRQSVLIRATPQCRCECGSQDGQLRAGSWVLDLREAGSPWGSTGAKGDTSWPQIVQMSNYCGIGIDAELSLDFHQAREEEPGKFTSRLVQGQRGLPGTSWGLSSYDRGLGPLVTLSPLPGSTTRACMCGSGCRRSATPAACTGPCGSRWSSRRWSCPASRGSSSSTSPGAHAAPALLPNLLLTCMPPTHRAPRLWPPPSCPASL